MALLQQTYPLGFSTVTNHATSVINLHHRELKDKFPDKPICFMDYFEKVDLKNVVEIRLDAEKVTLTCVFNGDKRCISSFLFFDNHTDVLSYIEYIKSNFTYDYITSRWMLSHIVMSVKKIDGIVSCMFYK